MASQLRRASIAAWAELSITATKSSSTVEDELRCFGRSGRSPASTFSEVMRNAVLKGTRMPGRAWRPRRSVPTFSIGHDPAHNFLLKRACCRFAQAIGVTSDPRITLPYLLKICASTLGLCAAPAGSGRRRHHPLEGPINFLARGCLRPHQRRRPDQTLVEPAAP
jgi:hypothetical protein